jgi:hypothetical protein
METSSNQNTIPAATETPQETIFSDMLDTSAYQKPIRNARIWLYVIAALQACMGIYEYASIDDKNIALISLLIDCGIGALFLFFAILSYKKPFVSFVAALVTYLVFQVGMMFLDPGNIYKGIILKVIIVVALIRAITNARDIQKFEGTMQ